MVYIVGDLKLLCFDAIQFYNKFQCVLHFIKAVETQYPNRYGAIFLFIPVRSSLRITFLSLSGICDVLSIRSQRRPNRSLIHDSLRSYKVATVSPVHALAGGYAGTSNFVARFSSVFSKASSLKVPKFPACYRWNYPCM